MKYRSRSEIIGMILQTAANNGSTKMRIMYSAYLSFAQAKEYLRFLEERDLIRYDRDTQFYKLTDKGLRFLRNLEEINQIIALGDVSKTTA